MLAEVKTNDSRENTISDRNASEIFLERISEIINSGAQSAMISIGHRSGLFDVMAGLKPGTSQEISKAAKLTERYVREWLAAMVTSGIVSFDPATGAYDLPDSHAACLTRDSELDNVAIYAQFVSLLGAVEEQSLRLLKHGGGTSYEDYPCFHQIMAEDSEQSVVSSLFDIQLSLVAGLDEKLELGIDVLDVGCGKARALIAMAERYPQSRFVGYDLCEETIADAIRTSRVKNIQNVQFVVKDLAGFDEYEKYDFVTSFDAVHDQKNPQKLIASIYDALKPCGVYLMQDIGGSALLENNLDFPMASFLYSMSFAHCTPISIGQGGEGLGTMWGWETAKAMLEKAKFVKIRRHVLPHDPMNVYFVSHKKAQYHD